jgi:putative SOS response-associated peptidase YedK
MCGRFLLFSSGDEIARALSSPPPPPFAARYNIAPTQTVIGLRWSKETDREWARFRWGLIPSWAKDDRSAARMINARVETAAEKPAFRSAFKRRRCLLPADGFYEWQKIGRRKRPLCIRVRDNHPFAFAGLWDRWHGPDGPVESCTILTTEANSLLRTVHDRMPVILPPHHFEAWLDKDQQDLTRIHSLLVPFPSDAMRLYPVGPQVGDVHNDDSSCAAPLDVGGPSLPPISKDGSLFD